MRAALLTGVTAALVAAAAGCGGTSIPDGISQLRVCTDRVLDSEESVCSEDERAERLVAPRFNCSVRIANRAGRTIHWRFLLDGQEVVTYRKPIPKGRGTMAAWVLSQPEEAESPLPGGRWTCTATLADQSLSASFRSGGPLAPVQALAVCRTSSSVATEGGVRVCPRDESADPIGDPQVTCSAGLANAKGRSIELAVLRDGVTLFAEGPIEVPKVMNVIGATMRLDPGSYACAYALDGRTVAVKRFTVG